MPITVITRYSGNEEAIQQAAKANGPLILKYGAKEARLLRTSTGPHIGQYIVILPALNTVIVRQGIDTIGGARFEIDRFVLDVTRAIQAADQDRAAGAEALRQSAEEENAPRPRVPLRGNWQP
jgi:hypothetical protein